MLSVACRAASQPWDYLRQRSGGDCRQRSGKVGDAADVTTRLVCRVACCGRSPQSFTPPDPTRRRARAHAHTAAHASRSNVTAKRLAATQSGRRNMGPASGPVSAPTDSISSLCHRGCLVLNSKKRGIYRAPCAYVTSCMKQVIVAGVKLHRELRTGGRILTGVAYRYCFLSSHSSFSSLSVSLSLPLVLLPFLSANEDSSDHGCYLIQF